MVSGLRACRSFLITSSLSSCNSSCCCQKLGVMTPVFSFLSSFCSTACLSWSELGRLRELVTSSSVSFSAPRGANSIVSFSPASSRILTDLVPDLVPTLAADFSWLVSPGEEGRELARSTN